MQWLLAVLDAPGEVIIVVASSCIDGLAISKVSGAVECCELGFSETVRAKKLRAGILPRIFAVP